MAPLFTSAEAMLMSRSLQADNRSIYLIQPKFPPTIWGIEYLLRMTQYQAIFPPLGLLTLGALTPRDFQVTICDENAGDRIDYDTSAQIVGITGYLLQKSAVLAHAEQFRKRGKTVVMGGPLANLLPEVCRPLPILRHRIIANHRAVGDNVHAPGIVHHVLDKVTA
jgi:hypothetical protein